jgi:hypothetical protein
MRSKWHSRKLSEIWVAGKFKMFSSFLYPIEIVLGRGSFYSTPKELIKNREIIIEKVIQIYLYFTIFIIETEYPEFNLKGIFKFMLPK